MVMRSGGWALSAGGAAKCLSATTGSRGGASNRTISSSGRGGSGATRLGGGPIKGGILSGTNTGAAGWLR